jgi:hypothetical protein
MRQAAGRNTTMAHDPSSLPAMEREIEETGLPDDAEHFLDLPDDDTEVEDATDP